MRKIIPKKPLDTTNRVSTSDMKARMREVFTHVYHGKNRVILTNHSYECALIPIEDLEKLEKLEHQNRIKRCKTKSKTDTNEELTV